MSRVLDIAELIKARLESRPALAGVDIVVDRQKDLATVVSKGVGKAKGCCVTILFEGFQVPDRNTPGPQVRPRYTLRVWSRPIIKDDLPADEVVEEIARALHHWIPEGLHAYGEMTVTGGDLVPDKTWLIYEIETEMTLKL